MVVYVSAVPTCWPDSPSIAIPTRPTHTQQVGQSVYALGARYGEGKSMSAGVVSGLGRAIPAPTGTRIYGVIQVCVICALRV